MDMLSPYDGSRLGAILLLLSMDNSTTAPVRRAIAETLPLLYAVDTDEGVSGGLFVLFIPIINWLRIFV